MTANIRRAAVCIAIAGWLSLPVMSDDKPADNLLKNGSFEKVDAKGVPTGWTLAAEGGKADYKVITDKPKEGKNCLRIKGAVEWAAAFTKLPLERNKTYTLTGYVRATRGTAVIKFDYFKGNEHLGQTLGDLVPAPESEWKKLTVTSETDQYPDATHIAVTVAGLGDSECDFDVLVLTAK